MLIDGAYNDTTYPTNSRTRWDRTKFKIRTRHRWCRIETIARDARIRGEYKRIRIENTRRSDEYFVRFSLAHGSDKHATTQFLNRRPRRLVRSQDSAHNDLFQSTIVIVVIFSRQVYTWNPLKLPAFILVRYGWFRSVLPDPRVLAMYWPESGCFGRHERIREILEYAFCPVEIHYTAGTR